MTPQEELLKLFPNTPIEIEPKLHWEVYLAYNKIKEFKYLEDLIEETERCYRGYKADVEYKSVDGHHFKIEEMEDKPRTESEINFITAKILRSIKSF